MLGYTPEPDRECRKRACGSHPAGELKTRNADPFRAPPSPETARGARTEHVHAAPRMLCGGPLWFLSRGPPCLLAQPELAVAGRPSQRLGLEVVSEPPAPPPSSSPRLGSPLLPAAAGMSARPPARGPRLLLLLLLLLGTGPRPGSAFYLPGLAPVNFCTEEKKTDECKVGEAWRAGRGARWGGPREGA